MTWVNCRLLSQKPSPLSAQAHSSYRDRRGGLLSYPVTFLAFCMLMGALSIHLSSFPWVLGPYPLICLALGSLSVRASSCCHLGQWGRLPNILTVYGNAHNPIVSHEIKLLDD